jgi:asparagine synthase (glutamine-hydrolysing)
LCGITGALTLNHKTVNTRSVKPMVDILAHRGPDDAGYLFVHTGCRHQRKISFLLNLTDNKFRHISELLPPIESRAVQNEINSHHWDLFLGHRRLAVLDVSSAGHQPMSDLSKSIWIVFNGEIYNYLELRDRLKKLGHNFRTGTDTEVIIYAYIEWGIKFLDELNGMFALALYDNHNKKLFVARDRYGIKPLYYTITNEPEGKKTLLFASEVKSIMQYGAYNHNIDYEALVEYFTFQNFFTDRTLYKDIKLLMPGTYLQIDLPDSGTIPSDFELSDSKIMSSSNFGHSALSLHKYWDYSFHETETVKDEREYIEHLNRLFVKAVERHLVSDVEVGSYLSGGIDSGGIACIAAKKNPNLKTFTIGFDLRSASGLELGYDERAVSEYLSYLYKTEHYEMVLKAGDMERCLQKFTWHLEEPRVGQSYPNFYAAKLAGNFVKVCLSGAGGDEIFGGYPWRYYRAVVNNDFDDYIDKYYGFWQRLIRNKDLRRIFAPIWDKVEHVWTRDIFKDVFPEQDRVPCSPEEYVNRSLYFEAKTFLHGLFVVEDKLSMAHSLETRVPFMDNDLIDFAMKLPVKFKLGNLSEIIKFDENEPLGKKNKFFQKTRDGKLILRKMMEQYVPEDIAKGIKKGFSSPDQSWFRGESIDLVKQQILRKDSPLYNYFDRASLEKIVSEHMEGKKNRRLFIWSLINFDEWLRVFNING